MTFASSVSERDQGVKVLEFQIKAEPEDANQSRSLISKMEDLVADLKKRAAAAQKPEARPRR
jgi:hypothetical protein